MKEITSPGLIDPRSIDPRELERTRRLATIVRSKLEAAGIDPTDPDFAEMLDNEVDLRSAIVGYIRLSREREALANGLKGLIDEMTKRKQRFERIGEAFHDAAEAMFLESGWTKAIREPDFTVSRSRAAGGVVGDLDCDTLPERFVKTEKTPMKKEIAKFLKDGGKIDGVHLGNGRDYMRVTK